MHQRLLIIAVAVLAGSTASTAQVPGRRPITREDVERWNHLGQRVLSNDGKWFIYHVSRRSEPGRNDTTATLVIVNTAGSKPERRIRTGGRPGGSFAVSDDSKWLGYLIGAAKGTETAASNTGSATGTLTLLNLETGETRSFDGISRFSFAGNGGWLELSGSAGGQLVLHEIATRSTFNLSRVREQAFSKNGKLLAYTLDNPDRIGNGIQIFDLETKTLRSVVSDRAIYQSLQWANDSDDRLLVLAGVVDSAATDTTHQIRIYEGIARSKPTEMIIAPGRRGIPPAMRIAATGQVRWSADNGSVFFGLRPADSSKTAPKRDGEDRVKLNIWHWQDPRLPPQQEKERGRDDNHSYLSVFHLGTGKFVQLADDTLREIGIAPKDKWGLASDQRKTALENSLSGWHYADLYAIDLTTGARKLLLENYLMTRGMGAFGRPKRYFFSPDGVHVLTWHDNVYTVHDLSTGKARPLLTKPGPAFGSQPNDHSPHKAPIDPKGWSTDGRIVLLSDGWDIWAVSITGGDPINLTRTGEARGIRYGWIVEGLTGESGGRYGTVDVTKPWFVGTISHWTKESGIVRIDGLKPGVQRILWDSAQFSPTKAKDADVVVLTRETAIDPPDYYLTDMTFANLRRVSDQNPQRKELLWPAGTVVVDYQGPSGERLQASILLPADYQKGKRYPAIVEIYEKTSFNRTRFEPPAADEAINAVLFASRGYAVISPDINYLKDRPGTSALICVLNAARAAVAAGYVDSTRVGLTGHSWGGYETAFIVTQTPFFRAALAGAAPTEAISWYGGLYWGTGTAASEMLESDQGRLTTPYWRDLDTYVRESGVFHVEKVTTPVLILANDRDDAVDWKQGIEYFNVFRRAHKPIVMLQYVGEGHGVSGAANRLDYARRAREFFDHFLLGRPAPKWWTEGVSVRGMDRHLRERAATDSVLDR